MAGTDVVRITIKLQEMGWNVSKDRVERVSTPASKLAGGPGIWRREGLKVPQSQKPRGRLWLNDGSCVRLRPEHHNHFWSYDFMSVVSVQPFPLDGRLVVGVGLIRLVEVST